MCKKSVTHYSYNRRKIKYIQLVINDRILLKMSRSCSKPNSFQDDISLAPVFEKNIGVHRNYRSSHEVIRTTVNGNTREEWIQRAIMYTYENGK